MVGFEVARRLRREPVGGARGPDRHFTHVLSHWRSAAGSSSTRWRSFWPYGLDSGSGGRRPALGSPLTCRPEGRCQAQTLLVARSRFLGAQREMDSQVPGATETLRQARSEDARRSPKPSRARRARRRDRGPQNEAAPSHPQLIDLRACSVRAAPIAVLTFFRSSGGGRTASMPRACSHSSRHQPRVWYRCSSSSFSTAS